LSKDNTVLPAHPGFHPYLSVGKEGEMKRGNKGKERGEKRNR